MNRRPTPANLPGNIALAVAAHPDDIEFLMAGTLLLLKRAGWTVHYWNLATGNCGGVHAAKKLRATRRQEAQAAARFLGAVWHPPLTDDLEILYETPLLRRVAAVIRQVRPRIILTQSPQDYMEDHANTSRLVVTGAFARGMPNYRTVPPRRPTEQDVTIYHALPHGLRDALRRRVVPGAYVDTSEVQADKRAALAAHTSQKAWLDETQGMDSYLDAMDAMAREVGRWSRAFRFAEGWRRHSYLGFSAEDVDPLRDVLGRLYRRNSRYEADLDRGDRRPGRTDS